MVDDSEGLCRDDLSWYERPFWFLLSSVMAGAAAVVLSFELALGFPQSPVLWLVFVTILSGHYLGAQLGNGYLAATQEVWKPGIFYRPLWRSRVGRAVIAQIIGGTLVAMVVAIRLVPFALSTASPPEANLFVTGALVAIFELSLGAAMLLPVYHWLRRLPD